MILPDFVLQSTQNLITDYVDPDTPDNCNNLDHFRQYPYQINYQYNSRGYRDAEWPKDLASAVWCFGDSFTVGIGSPVEHTWPWILQQQLNQRTINISMMGASNNWICRQVLQVIQQIGPVRCVIQWSYLHRREKDEITVRNELWQTFYKNIKDPSWPDCANYWQIDRLPTHIQKEIIEDFDCSWQKTIHDDYRRLHFCHSTVQQDIDNTLDCMDLVSQATPNAIHSFVPNFADVKSRPLFETQLKTKNLRWIAEQPVLDLARDGIHYDIKTAELLVDHMLRSW
jgi:hypothetical protein